VRGGGEKTAVDLLQKYETLEGVFEHLDELSQRQQNLLRGQKEQAELSQLLATIVTNAPVELDLEKCAVKDFRSERAIAALRKLQFKSLVKEFEDGRNLKSEKEDSGQLGLL